MSSTPIPECPFPSYDRETIRLHLEKLEEIQALKQTLRARSFGQRVLKSTELRTQIARLTSQANAEVDYHQPLLNQSNLDAYEAWREEFTLAVEQNM